MPDDYDLNPVDYQPTFAEPFAIPQTPVTPEQTETFRTFLRNTAGAPGVAMQPVVPETPGMLSDVDVAKQLATDERLKNWAPQQALNMVGQGAPMAVEGAAGVAGGKLPIRAYHGSPHDFERFDISKIGTGEGAQVYTEGLYFAEHEPVASSYRQASHMIDGKSPEQFLADTPKIDTVYDALRYLKEQGHSPTIEDAAKFFQESPIPAERNVADALKTYGSVDRARRMMTRSADLDDMLEAGRVRESPGRMYEVDIHANPEHFLDWDKPLSEQPQVVEKLQSLASSGTAPFHKILAEELQPRKLELPGQMIAQVVGRYPDLLREAGIPGVKYMDQHSRIRGGVNKMGDSYFVKGSSTAYKTKQEAEAAAEENITRNYVVYDDKAIDVVKKYGLAGLIAGGAGHFATKAVDYTPQFDDAKHAKGGAVKLSHTSVGYVAPSTHLPQKCGGCTMFLPPSGCTLVQSPIKAGGWCRRFEKGIHAPSE